MVSSFPGAFPAIGVHGSRCDYMLLANTSPSPIHQASIGEMRWWENCFYFPSTVLVLPYFSDARPMGVALDAWGLFPSVEEAMEVLALLGAIEALRA